MNKAYDKVLLGAALLLLVVAIGYFALASGSAPDGYDPPLLDSEGRPYVAVEAPTTEVRTADWPAPAEQFPDGPGSEPWVYQIFTPPKIFVDPDTGEFKREGARPPEAFGVYLAKISRNPYRFQLEGFVAEDPTDVKKSRIILYNAETDKNLYAFINDSFDAAGVRIDDFDVDKQYDASGILRNTVVTCAITDLRSGREIVLTQGETFFDEGITISIASNEDPGVDVTLEEVGETFTTPSGSYVLDAIDVDAKSVTVTKQASEVRKAVTEVLFEQAAPPPPPEPAAGDAATPDAPGDDDVFDLFQ